MGKRARRIAEGMADAHFKRAGITKGAGGPARADLVAAFMPYAEGVAVLQKTAERLAERHRQQEAIAAQIAGQVRQLQALQAAESSPVLRGWRPFDPGEDVVGLVGKQAAPKMNGHHYTDPVTSSPPPAWHPDSED